MIRREMVVAAILAGLAASVAAQTPAPDASQDQRYQLQTFEVVLQAAVRHGGDIFARQQAQFIPDGVQLTARDPQARGFAPPLGGGLLFYVAVPQIRPIVNEILVGVPRSSPLRATSGAPPMVRTAGAQGVAPPDPMTVSPLVDDGRCATRVKQPAELPNFNYDYAVAVCDSLLDAILDGSGPLPIKGSEVLTVAAANGEPDSTPTLNSPTGYTMYLSIKGSDLLAYRQGKMSKEEARKLVDLTQK
jgi:hypothetical protein